MVKRAAFVVLVVFAFVAGRATSPWRLPTNDELMRSGRLRFEPPYFLKPGETLTIDNDGGSIWLRADVCATSTGAYVQSVRYR
jgi:hypothetical protein